MSRERRKEGGREGGRGGWGGGEQNNDWDSVWHSVPQPTRTGGLKLVVKMTTVCLSLST